MQMKFSSIFSRVTIVKSLKMHHLAPSLKQRTIPLSISFLHWESRMFRNVAFLVSGNGLDSEVIALTA